MATISKADAALKELVKIKLPAIKGNKGLYVNVNNHNYFIPRGQVVEVPAFIAEVIENSVNQDEATMLRIAQLTGGME